MYVIVIIIYVILIVHYIVYSAIYSMSAVTLGVRRRMLYWEA